MSTLKRRRHPMPKSVREALEAERLMNAYKLRPAYQRNDYIDWITRAKRAVTQERRLKLMLEELRRGGVYMKMKWKPRRPW